MALGLVAAGALAVRLPHKYMATAKVVVSQVPSDTPDQTKTTPAVAIGTEAQIARSSVVRELAGRKYLPKSMDPQLLNSGLVVSIVTDSSVLLFDFTAKRADQAVAGAQAYAAAYLDNRGATAQAFVNDVILQLQSQAKVTQQQIDAAQKAKTNARSGSSERTRQQAQLNLLNQRLLNINNDLATRQNSRIEPGIEITKPAAAHRTGAKAPVVIAAGLILGLVVGLGAATLRERTDPRLREAGDIQDDLGVPLLAVLPPHDLDAVIDPDSAAADAYRTLRNEIFLGPRPPVVLAVSRVDNETGTGDVTANLAVLLSRSGRRVCVIDTDTGPRRLETLLEGVDRVGLVHAPGGENLDAGIAVVTQRAGVGQAKLGDVLASPLFARLVDATRSEAEVVLIDAPPALTSSGQAVLSTADAVLLIVTRRRTRRSDVLAADDRIRRVGSRLIGTAVRESERVRDAAPAAVRREQPQPALPPAGRRALPGEPGVPTNVRVGAGTVYHPNVPNEAFEPQRPLREPGTSMSGPPQGPRPEPTPVPARAANGGEHAPTPLGWPETEPETEPEAGPETPTTGTTSGLGWPPPRRAITGPEPAAS
jgi:Mrp family chromosome partitioning ATPase